MTSWYVRTVAHILMAFDCVTVLLSLWKSYITSQTARDSCVMFEADEVESEGVYCVFRALQCYSNYNLWVGQAHGDLQKWMSF